MCSDDKILIVSPFPPKNIGGAETFLIDLSKALSKHGVVYISTLKWTKPVLWDGLPLVRGLNMACRLFLATSRLVSKHRFKRVYALGVIASFVCVLLRLKYSAVMLALYDFKKPHWFRHILSKAEKVYVEGVRGQQDMVNIGVNLSKIVCFQHWCDQTKFFWKERNNVNLKVLFVGRPIKIKGKHIIQQCERMTKGIDYEYIENVPYSELPRYYQSADVVVVPSLYPEGFSRVVIESASCGCALVTSNMGSLPELVAPFGKCIYPNSYAFAEVLMKLRNRKSLEKIQLDTALYAKQHFSESNADCFLCP